MTINPTHSIGNPSNQTIEHKKSDSPAEHHRTNRAIRVTTAVRASFKKAETTMATADSKEESFSSYLAKNKQSLLNDLDAIIRWTDGSKCQKSAPENSCPVNFQRHQHTAQERPIKRVKIEQPATSATHLARFHLKLNGGNASPIAPDAPNLLDPSDGRLQDLPAFRAAASLSAKDNQMTLRTPPEDFRTF
jgi:hypothetical protein